MRGLEGRCVKTDLKTRWAGVGLGYRLIDHNCSTSSNIIQTAYQQARKTEVAEHCTDKNLASFPNSVEGANMALTPAQKEHLIEVTLEDADYCRMIYSQLAEAGRKFSIYICIYIFFFTNSILCTIVANNVYK